MKGRTMSATAHAEPSQSVLGKLTNTVIECSDVDAAAAFYTETLGLPVKARGDGWLVADGGSGVVVLYQGAEPHITLGFTGANLDAARELLDKRGANPGPIVAHPTGHHFNVTDPEGNQVMISD
jgi:catechol 2,3-dioxygenase-like lactoylglutathione lyase family enzyme